MTKLYSSQFLQPKNISKAVFTGLLGLLLLSFSPKAYAQCAGGNTQGFSNFSCNSNGTISNANQGDYYRFSVVSGVNYTFSSVLGFNPRVYARVNNSSGSLVFDQDNSTATTETVNWNSTFTGTLAVATKYSVCTFWLAGYSATLTYSQNTTVSNTTSNGSICVGSTKSLTASLGGAHNNPTVVYTIVGGSGNGSISGSTFTATSPGTITVRATVGVCTSDVTFTVLSASSGPSSLSASSTTVCPGDNVTLTANSGSLGSGAQYYWYTGGSCSGSSFDETSSNQITVNPSSTTTYSVRIVGTCNTTTCRSVTVNVTSTSSGPSNITKSTDDICPGTSVTLTAQGGSLGDPSARYYWYNGGSCGGTAFAVTTGNTTTVAPTSTATYSCRIIGACNTTSCVNITVNVTQTNSSGPASLTSSANPICSGTNITLTANSGSLGTGASYQWFSNVSCSGSPFTTTGTNTLSQSPSSTTQYSVRISGSCNTTPCQATTVTVTPNVGVPSAPSGVTQRCAGAGTNTYTSSASSASSYSWSLLPASAGSINSSGTVTWNSSFVGTATVTVTASGCGSNQSSSTSVEVYQVPNSNAGSGGSECDLSAALQAISSVGNGTWSQQLGPGTTSFSSPNNASTNATVTQYGSYVFRWTENNGVCSDFDQITVDFYEQPDADAGNDATVCGFTYNLNANASVGTGTWTKVFGAGTVNFSNANSASSTVTVPQAGLYVFRWTEVNGTCSDFDEVDITFVQQPVANAGSGGNECDLNFTFNAVASVGTGTWTQQSGPGVSNFNNANSTTATVTVSAYGTYVYRWTEVNGICSDYAEVTVNYYLQPVAVAGSGGSRCELFFTFSGSTPNAGTGTWSQASGPGTSIFGNPNSPTSTVTATAYGTYVYKWKVVNGTCSDSANVTVNYYEQPVADAGTNGLECDLTHQFNAVPSVGTGTWTQAGGAGITTGYAPNANSPTATATVSTYGSYFYTWTEVNGICSSSETVQVLYNEIPTATISVAGEDTICLGDSTLISIALTGSSPWSVTYTDGSTPVTVNNISSSPYTFYTQDDATYTVTNVTDFYNCVGTNLGSADVFVNALPVQPVITNLSGLNGFCQGLFTNLSSSSDAGYVSYLWSPNSATTQVIAANVAGDYVVTVTDTNDCQIASDTMTIVVYPNPVPVITANGPTTICQGQNVVLTSSAASTYLWSPGGQTTQSITVTQSGNYTVHVVDSNGCEGTSQIKQVTVNPLPTATITPFGGSSNGSTTFCQGQNVLLLSSSGASYLWSPGGQTTQIISVNSTSTHQVTVTDGNGCSATSTSTSVTVNSNPTPTISAGGPTTFCAGSNVTLTASSGNTYLWSNGATTQSTTVSASGSYTVTVGDGNGCTGTSAPTVVTVNSNPAPTITASGPTTFCAGGNVTLTASAGATYAWSSGDTTQAINVTSSGAFTVTVTDANGCVGVSSTTNVTVNPNPTPTVSAGGPTTFCAGGSVTLTSSASSGNVWSTGLVGQSITVTQSGNYSTTVTNSNGCVGTSNTVTVTVNPNPVVSITPSGPTNFCNGGNVTLTASSGAAYSWSSGDTSQAVLVTTAGTYTVTVTDANGCTGTATQSVTVYNNPAPTISPLGPTTFCQGGSVQLVSSASTSYLWAPGGQTSQIITVNATGNYSVTVTDANGCSGTSAPTAVTVNSIPAPTISAGGPTTFCQGGSVTLTASSGTSYLWSSGATTQSINVTSGGSYTVAVTDANGCTGTSSATVVTVNANPTPNINPSGATTFCDGGSVTLTASSAVTYAWSNGVTGQSFSTDTSGTYVVTVTDANGCVGTSPTTTVTVNPNPVATITPSGPTTFCAGGSVTLTSSSATGNVWSTGVVSQSINVTQSGNYTVVVTNGFGCSTTSAPTTVTVNPNPTPVITSTGLNGLCDGDTILLTTNYLGSGHVWTPGGSTNDTLVVTASGTYSVNYTDGNGCSANSSPITVNIGSLPQPVITALGPTTFCAGGNVTLFSSSNTGNLWSNGATTQFITVSTAGDYWVTVTDGGGCTGTSDTTTIVVNANPTPTITPSGPTTFCAGGSVNLMASSATSYIWSSGSTAQTISVASSGTFTVTVTDANGCTGTSSSTSVTVNTNPTPTISASGPTTFCNGGSVTLTASSAAQYLWSNGVTTQSFSTDTSGTYMVTVTDANGCVGASSSTTVTVNPNPVPVITPSGPTTFCSGGSVTLTSNATSGNVWSNGLVSQSITVTQAGDYWVTVTNGNGCTTISDTTTVTINNNPTPTITPSGPTTFCAGGSVTLTASPGATYAWSSGDTTQSINVTASGSFSVFVSDGNGCSGTSATVVVTVNANPTPTVTPLGPTTFCQGQSVQLLSTASTSYLWSPGAVTSQIMTATATGSYSVTVTDANGCSGTSTPVSVTVNALPAVSFTGLNARYCLDAPAATLVGSPLGGSFSLPAIGNTFTPSSAGVGTYNVTYTYTNGNNCTNSATQQVIVDTIPIVSFVGLDAAYCVDAPADSLTGSPAGGTFSGPGISGNIFTPSAATVGTHNITYYFIDGFGCDDSQTQSVVVNPLPVLSISGISNPYCEDASLDSLIGVPSGGTFSGTGIFGDFFDPIFAGVGSHTVTYDYTDANGCFNTLDSTLVVVPLPTVSFAGLLAEYCIDGSSSTLTGSPLGGTFSGPGISGNTFNPASAGLGTHTITYTYTDANGCTNSFSVNTDVVALPSVSFAGLQLEYCVDGDTSVLTGIPSGGVFSGPGIFGNEFRPATAGQGTHTITYTYTDSSGCTNFITQNVTVYPLPVISFSGLAARYCINANASLLTGSPAGGTFTGSGLLSGNTFDPQFAGLGNHSITFTFTNGNGCTNSLTQQTEVVDLPVVTFSGLNPEYCISDASTVLIGSPIGGSYSGPGIVSNTNTFSPFLAGTGTHSIIYNYTDTNGCQSADTQMVTINALPNVSFFDLDPEYCYNGPFETLFGVPAGGTFTGNGMNGNTFEPSTAAPGTHTVTYTYTDTNGCTNNYSQNVVVHALTLLNFTGLGNQYCVDAPPVTLVATPFGGTFTGSGVTGNQFDPSQAGVGVHTILYTFIDANGCTSSDVQTVEVVDIPNVSFTGLGAEYCVDASGVNLTGIPSGGTFSGNGILGNVFDPFRAGVGTHVITYSYTNANGCDDVFTDTVVVHALPVLSISGMGGPYCIDNSNGVTLVGSPSGGTFTGQGMTGDVFTPSQAGVGTHFITYAYTDTNGCSNTTTTSAVVNALPSVSFSGLQASYCVSQTTPVQLVGSPTGGIFNGLGVFGNTFIPSQAGVGLHSIQYDYTDVTGCTSSSNQIVTVNDLPVVSFSGLGAQYCVENAPVILTGTPSGGMFSGPGISGSSFNPGTAGVGFHTITYQYTDVNGCTNTTTQTVNVLQLAPPVITTNGPTTFCEGNTLTLDAGANYASYAWSDGNTITQTLIADHSATYAVTVTDTNGCTATSNVITVTTTPLPVVSLGPDFSICPNEDVTLSPSGAYNSYTWSTGEITPSIVISSDNIYWVEVSNANGCRNRDSVVVSLYNPIVPVIQSNGSSTICAGNQVTLDAGPDFISYSWSDNVTTTQTLNAGSTGVYIVTTVDSNGCEATSAPFIVNVQSLPGVPLYTNGPLSICEGENLQISTNAGFANYSWSTGGQTNTITVDTSGVYSVTVTDQNGCVNNSINLPVTVNPNPSPVVTIVEGDTEFCKGQDTLVLDAGAGYVEYNWTNGDTTRFITVTSSGTYGVSVRDVNGCGAGINSPVVSVTVHDPQTPVISIFPGDTLRASGAQSYQWYYNGTLQPGATSQIYVASVSGVYTVEVVDMNGCVASASIEYSPVGVVDLTDSKYINLYPNPGNGRFTISAEFNGFEKTEVSINNLLGQNVVPTVQIGEVNSFNKEFDLSGMPKGVYIVEVKFGDTRYISRYIKD